MRNKTLFTVLLGIFTLICGYNLFFTAQRLSMDSELSNMTAEKRSEWMKANEKDYKTAVKNSLALGLDLQGGMYVTMEIGVEAMLRTLAGKNVDSAFTKSLRMARELQKKDQSNYVDLFVKSLKETSPNAKLANYFSGQPPRPALNASDGEVVSYLKKEMETVVENSYTVLRNRIDQFGVVSPNVQMVPGSNRILLELPGVKDVKRVRELLKSTAKLEFWPTYTYAEALPHLGKINDRMAKLAAGDKAIESKADTAKADSAKTAKDAPKTADNKAVADAKTKESAKDTAKKKEATADTANMTQAQKDAENKKKNPLYDILKIFQQNEVDPNGPAIGYANASDTAKVNAIFNNPDYRALIPNDLRFLWSAKPRKDQGQEYVLVAIKTTPDGQAPLTGERVEDASPDFDQMTNQNTVSLTMDLEGARIWKKMTEQNLRKSIAVVLDNIVYSYPTVQSVISGGRSQITGSFTVEEAKDLGNILKAGKLPAPATIVGEEQVGPSLGADTIQAGLISFFLGFVSVIIFMALYYGKAGLIADFALVMNLIFLIAICSALNIVLTLPGIAGIVLTMGMAVDANILIYERIREELDAGKSVKGSVVEGFKNALSAIVDGNLTTFITGFMLFVFGTGIIRGFAVTLMIGIITTLITGLIVTRLVLDYMLDRSESASMNFGNRAATQFFRRLDFPFINKRKTSYVVATVLALACLGIMFTIPAKLGVDFKGGRQYVVELEKGISINEMDGIRSNLKSQFGGNEPEVKTLGSSNQLMITTSYKIDDANADSQVEQSLIAGLQKTAPSFKSGNIIRNTTVGPTVARDVIQAAIYSVIFSLLAMFVYIFVRFYKWQYGLGALASLIFNVVTTLGIYWLLGGLDILPFSMEVNQTLIAALLTIVGYTINDTVIIFDRIREKVLEDKFDNANRPVYFYIAIKETLSRTVVTVVTVLITILMMFIFGGDVLRGFMLAMLLGIIIGTLSSIFLAAPITLDLLMATEKRKSETDGSAAELATKPTRS
jgi:SecD/SecF fusion protein